MVPHIIPGHITALYIFAVLNLMVLFHITLVNADIKVLDAQNRTVGELFDMPASFGPSFPEEGLYGRVRYVANENGCHKINDIYPPHADTSIKYVALFQRYGCHFDEKVLNAQKARYAAVIIYNNVSNDLFPMGGDRFARNITIPSCLIGRDDARQLQRFGPEIGWPVLIDNRIPFNYNLYLLPFAIVVGICFLLMLIFMIAKWVRDFRRRRRARLSREHLKKLPTKKFKKGDPYDMCAICLDEYEEGDKLRILPCSHAYHMKCVDPWLTKNKRNCPVCKRKVIPGDEEDSDSEMETDDDNDAPSETTPLLTAQTASQLASTGQHHSAYHNSGMVSDANSAHAEDIQTDSDSDSVATPSTSAVVHSPINGPMASLLPAGSGGGGGGRPARGGYGSLHRSPNRRRRQRRRGGQGDRPGDGEAAAAAGTQAESEEDAGMNDNPEYRGAVGGVGVFLRDEDDVRNDEELRGIVSSDPEEIDESEDANTSLRVKVLSFFKGQKRDRRRRRHHEDA